MNTEVTIGVTSLRLWEGICLPLFVMTHFLEVLPLYSSDISMYRRGSEGLQEAVSVTRRCSLDSFLLLASLEHCGLGCMFPFKSRAPWKKSERKPNNFESDGRLLMLPR